MSTWQIKGGECQGGILLDANLHTLGHGNAHSQYPVLESSRVALKTGMEFIAVCATHHELTRCCALPRVSDSYEEPLEAPT